MIRQPRTALELLKDIPSETAQQMFNAVRYQSDAPGSTMIPDLDEYILRCFDSIPSLHSSLNRGDTIEIQGPAAAGKTQLLYHLAATCILPVEVLVNTLDVQAECNITIGGWQKSVVILDCDGRWDVRRLHTILMTRIARAFSMATLPPPPHKPDVTVSSIAMKSLSRMHLFRPTSSLQLAATLITLPKYHEQQMPHEEIRLLLVDSISSFYWADRWQAEPSGPNKTSRPNSLANVLRSLQAFRLSHGPVTILTNWGLNPLSAASPSSMSSSTLETPTPFFKQHLASPFPAPLDEPPRRLPAGETNLSLTCHITIPFTFVSSLQLSEKDSEEPGTGLEDALCEVRRQDVIERGDIGGYIRIPRPGRTQDTVGRSAFGRFKLQILKRDVVTALAGIFGSDIMFVAETNLKLFCPTGVIFSGEASGLDLS